ncbi:FCD domain-containing protein [Nonomuraea ceibae]|uniref:FCD domain-containing protein n=1 Tax=Nonomuraea ceibae TaxID=1935170 RepID=UPI0027DF66EA|nr:FCD domain-containing protein [Nonomuraea ceibae]
MALCERRWGGWPARGWSSSSRSAAPLAARRIGQGEHEAVLREVLRENATFLQGGEPAGYMDVNERFHHLVLDLADNEVLSRLGGQLHVMAYHLQTTRVIRAAAPDHELSVAGSARFHRDIGNAILRGEEDHADRLMRAHLLKSRDGILAIGHARTTGPLGA